MESTKFEKAAVVAFIAILAIFAYISVNSGNSQETRCQLQSARNLPTDKDFCAQPKTK